MRHRTVRAAPASIYEVGSGKRRSLEDHADGTFLGNICCIKSSSDFQKSPPAEILLTVYGPLRLGFRRWLDKGSERIFAMFEAVTALLGFMSAGIFLAHAVDSYRMR